MRRMYDAASPPSNPPAWEVVAGYIGGDTPHVWSVADWDSQRARYRLPIWTRSNPAGASEGTSEGQMAVARVRALGMPPGCAIGLDLETAVDAAYVTAFDAEVVKGGYKTIEYGSDAYIFKNPKTSDGYWDAQWNQVPHLNPSAEATQYAGDVQLGQSWDASLVSDSLVLWDTQGGTTPTPSPSNATGNEYNDMHVNLKVGETTVFTNPAAVTGVTTHMLLASDFGDAVVRVATYSFHTGGWTVNNYTIGSKGGALSLPLPPDTNKVSVGLQAGGTQAVGLDVITG